MKKTDKQLLFERMEAVNPDFKGKVNETTPYQNWDKSKYKKWSNEKTAGEDEHYGDSYEVENGEMIRVDDYDKWEHGKIIGRYNSKGEKIDEVSVNEENDEGNDRYAGKLDQIKAELSQVKSAMETGRTPKMYEKDGLLYVSAEDGEYFADYHGITSTYPEIDQRLEDIADKYGMYWDWEDAASIVLVPDM